METKQIQQGNIISYVTEDGYEDPQQIDLSYSQIYKPSRRKTRFDRVFTNNVFFNVLINNYIGRKHFFKQKKDIQKIFWMKQLRNFKQM